MLKPMSDYACPNCALPQPRDNKDCPGCHVVFAKWRERELRASLGPAPRPSAPAPAASDTLLRILPRFLILAAVPLGLWLYVRPPAGLPVPAGSHAEPNYHFSLSAPKDWQVARVNSNSGGSVHVLSMSKYTSQPLPLDLRVLVLPLRAGKLRFEVGERVRFLFRRVFDEAEYASVDQEFLADVQVDGLKAFRVSGRTGKNIQVTRTVMIQPAVNWGNMTLAPVRFNEGQTPSKDAVPTIVQDNEGRAALFRLYVIPGVERTYLMGVTGDAEGFPVSEIDQIVSSFRVTERPWGMSHLLRVFHGELQQELVLFLLGWVLGFYKWVFSPLLEH